MDKLWTLLETFWFSHDERFSTQRLDVHRDTRGRPFAEQNPPSPTPRSPFTQLHANLTPALD